MRTAQAQRHLHGLLAPGEGGRLRKPASPSHDYLRFHYLSCALDAIPAVDHLDSDNLVARLNLPNMHWSQEQKVDIYAKAIEGLLCLEPDIEKRIKYLDFVDIYTGLTDAERHTYESRCPQESNAMTGLTERLRSEGMQQGEQTLLRKLLAHRFGPLDGLTEQRLQQASTTELERWAENLMEAETLEEVFN